MPFGTIMNIWIFDVFGHVGQTSFVQPDPYTPFTLLLTAL